MAQRIYRARVPEDLEDFGANWIVRFKARHYARIKSIWESPLDSERAAGLNPVATERYFRTVGRIYEEEDIQDCCRYAADESGFWAAIGGAERVVGRADTRRQHGQQSGSRELTTVLATVCADGTHLPPLVIFKGDRLRDDVGIDNPDDALITCSLNGWIDGGIFAEWIHWFDQRTAGKADGRPRVLHLDSHKTHTTLEVDDYAADYGIIIIGYPPKSTHGLQGLDRVHFGRMKTLWPKEVKRFEEDHGYNMEKVDFLRVLHNVSREVFTAENNRRAFIVTGLTRPVDPSHISERMMAPSQESSTQGSLPLPQPTPVRNVTTLI
ncbi:DDE-domain-containing protein, partial [Polyporus arcularius HHB13444]